MAKTKDEFEVIGRVKVKKKLKESEKSDIQKKLEKKLKEYTFDYEDNDISGIMNLLDTEEDMQKMYDYIVDNNIIDTDDIYDYGFELCDDIEDVIGIEEDDEEDRKE